MKINERFFDAQTGETTDIERDMTAAELAEYNATIERKTKKAAEQAEKDAARQALLDKLGITEDEAKLLLGGN